MKLKFPQVDSLRDCAEKKLASLDCQLIRENTILLKRTVFLLIAYYNPGPCTRPLLVMTAESFIPFFKRRLKEKELKATETYQIPQASKFRLLKSVRKG